MIVSELIQYLEDCDPDLPVYVASSDHDYDWMRLHKEFISTEYVTEDTDEVNEPVESRALCLGDGHQ